MKKRLLLLLFLLLGVPTLLFGIYVIVILVDLTFNEPARNAPDPISFGSFNIIESSTIDPATILSSLNDDGQNVFSFKPGRPKDPPFVTSVEWRQVDFVNLATSIFHVAWKESVNDWKFYKMEYWTECNHPDGFFGGEFYFYSETSNNKEYSMRGILMEPEYGYVAWGGDAYYYRPLFGWKSINLEEMTVTAEEALHRAEASGGLEARQSWETCQVSVVMWPESFGRYDWRVYYWDITNFSRNGSAKFWIPAK